ncbi:glucosamine-6-phosphate deaminase [Aerococcus kribbianus]|uniref:Glucosamine-6-phosphate deaminase n=1 Tax=Aerococcus kribbianus TaxID=2999064 RepID=A0A9X3FNM0_9LACT|nr:MULTISPECIES: glucosamine-6-phosphate deaminase [unclassified Aerococcus]MCZ0717609.1 glucosamine-6-phosphate deaminase [Aerococcus sp. YH-aer221]MCZ0725897.1 glucosamine-6-phosphate deaminase [Aerococcus sp. YH-aer222]
MDIQIFENAHEASKKAVDFFEKALEKNQNVFGLATGSTPEALYEQLIDSSLDFSDAIAINLDEYYGLPANHPQSYAYFMEEHLFNAKPFKKTYIPNGENTNVSEEIDRYNTVLAENPIDLQLLGIGQNGHIGFNEPGSSSTEKTRLVDLTQETIMANSRFFSDQSEVPTQAYSMGLASIMSASQILLLAFGENKAEAIKAMIEGPVTSEVPASILQNHPNVTVLLDKEAAKLLEK